MKREPVFNVYNLMFVVHMGAQSATSPPADQDPLQSLPSSSNKVTLFLLLLLFVSLSLSLSLCVCVCVCALCVFFSFLSGAGACLLAFLYSKGAQSGVKFGNVGATLLKILLALAFTDVCCQHFARPELLPSSAKVLHRFKSILRHHG